MLYNDDVCFNIICEMRTSERGFIIYGMTIARVTGFKIIAIVRYFYETDNKSCPDSSGTEKSLE